MKYIWKIMRPAHEGTARAILQAAYRTAMQPDPTTTVTYIRSLVHPNTIYRGRFVEDEPHITISVKNPHTAATGQHQSSHGYMPHLRSYEVISVSPSGHIAGPWYLADC
ncbi:uncharacterized protein BDV14DRAFT_203242 [Aspergillus stella-maris]|uniref:uncharacterized protein n=1 Tax=Aspergillus stella-maris TaxID=1810926 RepID=UPI003CCD863F